MRVYGRIAGMFAGAAFVLSFIVGLLSSNPFATVLLRGILLAVVFGAFGAALRYVFTKYLSEAAQPAAAADGKTGQAVDITLPEEAPPVHRPEREDDAPLAAEAEAVEDAQPSADGSLVDEALSPGFSGTTLEDELTDQLPPLMDHGRGGTAEDEESDSSSEGVEEAESVTEDAPEQSEPGAGPRAGRPASDPGADAGLDSLPDISSLGVSSPGRAVDPDSRASRRGAPAETADDVMKGKLSGQDPATLARAIRTVLKRDERG